MATKFLRQIILEELKKVLKEETLTGKDKSYNVDTRGDDLGPCVNPGDPGCGDTDLGTQKIVTRKSPCGPGYDPRCRPDILELQKHINKIASYLPTVKKVKLDGLRGPETDGALKILTGLSFKDLIDKNDIRKMIIPSFKEMLASFTNKDPKKAVTSVMKEICRTNPSNILCKYSPSQEMAARQALDKTQAELDALGGPSMDDYAAIASGGMAPTSKAAIPGPSSSVPDTEMQEFDKNLKKGLNKSFLTKEALLRKELARLLKNL